MKRAASSLLAGLFLYGGVAHGETTLVITETLQPGQLGVDVSYNFAHTERDIENGGKQYRNRSASDFGLGIGLLPNLEIDFSVPYVYSSRSKSEFPLDFAQPLQYSKIDGVGDFTFGTRYAIISPKGEGFGLATGIDVKFDTAGDRNAGTGTTEFSPIVAASYTMGNLKPYFAYQPTFANHGDADTHDFSIGTHIRLGESVILNPKFNAGFTTSTDSTSSFEDYTFRLSAYFRLLHGLYLTTSGRVTIESGFDTWVPESQAIDAALRSVRFKTATGYGGVVGLYFEY